MSDVVSLCGTESGTYQYVAVCITLDLADRQHDARTFPKLGASPVHEWRTQHGSCVELDQPNRKGIVETRHAAQHTREVKQCPGAIDLDPFISIRIQVSPRI